MRMLLHWVITALAVWITSRLVSGFYIDGAMSALIAAAVIGFVNATLGLIIKIITFPLTILTFGLFWLIVNGVMLELASAFVPGFHIRGFAAAFWGAIVLAIVNMLLKWLVMPERHA
jgi:putative membrane protein